MNENLAKELARQKWLTSCQWSWHFAFTRTHVSTRANGEKIYIWFRFYEKRRIDGTYIMGTWECAYRYKSYPELIELEGDES